MNRGVKLVRRQRGAIIILALLVLVALTLTGLGLMRSVDTGTVIAGNISFRQGATYAADAGIEAGRTWLLAQSEATLINDQASGYFANWQNDFDPKSFDWETLATELPVDANSVTVSYVIHRLCSLSNASVNAPNQSCSQFSSTGTGSSNTAAQYGSLPLSSTLQVYYRITARAVGPRNSTSYVQVVLY
jgi:type IV pilus assembly protein PilX